MTDDQIDALDTFALHAMAPRGRQSVRDFARAVLAAASEAAKPVGWMSPIELKNLGIARECNDNRGFIIRPSQLPDYIPTVPLYTAAPTDSQAGRDAVEAARGLIAALDQPFRYPGEIKAARDKLELALAVSPPPATQAGLTEYQQIGLLEWAVARWRDEVQNRPLVNVHRRTLDDTWRQVMRYAGGDPKSLVGWSHDELLAGHEFEPANRAALSTTTGRAAE